MSGAVVQSDKFQAGLPAGDDSYEPSESGDLTGMAPVRAIYILFIEENHGVYYRDCSCHYIPTERPEVLDFDGHAAFETR